MPINQRPSDGNVILFVTTDKTCTVYDTVKSANKWSEVPNYFKFSFTWSNSWVNYRKNLSHIMTSSIFWLRCLKRFWRELNYTFSLQSRPLELTNMALGPIQLYKLSLSPNQLLELITITFRDCRLFLIVSYSKCTRRVWTPNLLNVGAVEWSLCALRYNKLCGFRIPVFAILQHWRSCGIKTSTSS